MKKSWMRVLSLALLLTGCRNSGAVLSGLAVKKNFALGNDLYLRGTFNSWETPEAGKLTYQEGSPAKVTYRTTYTFAQNDCFKVASSDWSASVNADQLMPISRLNFENANTYQSSSDNNIRCLNAGTYDVLLSTTNDTTGKWWLSLVRSATQLLENQDLNYTRTTAISASASAWSAIQSDNRYSSITVNRTTEFIDHALYMHSIDDSTNSGYYTPASTPNDLYHYVLKDGADYRNTASEEITSVRHDSTTLGVNDFFMNGHYFHDHSATVAPVFTFDFDNGNYYATAAAAGATLVQNWMYFTAPLFTNSSVTPIAFLGIGLKDCGNGEVKFYLYADNTMVSGGDTVFAVADITAVGTTVLSALDGYIAGTKTVA
jgi:hypothetical protein